MKKILVYLIFLGLAGCATTAKYEAKLNSWIGIGDNALIASWGIPDKTYEMREGKKAVEYGYRRIIHSGGYSYSRPQTVYHSGTIGGQSYSGESTVYVTETEPVRRHKVSCKTTFIIDKDGIIENWHHKGNHCVSR